jgi:hypothetical protein
MAADPRHLTAVRQIASDRSWASTPNRTERTAAARKASPRSLDYWIAKTAADGIVREQDQAAAAQSAHRAYMRDMSLRAVAARRALAEQRRRPNSS